jgi:hypothetical protein
MTKDNLKNETANSTNTVLCPVIFEGRKYFGIREFDCKCVGLFTEKTLQGTFFTVIPISNSEYRKKSPTKAKVEIETKDDWTIFKMFNDWGQCHKMEIHNSLSKEIEFAKQKAVEQGLL